MPSATPLFLRIGAFSRLARVTIKTLRFYDRAGVFPPAWTDPRTGYRYYSSAQLPTIGRIRLLRQLGCSVAEVAQLLRGAANGLNAYQVAGLRRRLMIQVARAEQRLQRLDALCADVPATRGASGHLEALPIVDREISAIPAFVIRDCARSGSTDIHNMFESAERKVARRGIRAQQSPFLLLHDADYRQPYLDVEVCIPTINESLGSADVRLIEPVSYAKCVQFAGSYDQAPILLDAALDSTRGTGVRIAGPIREVYLRFGADQRGYTLDPSVLRTHEAQYLTELQIPVRTEHKLRS